MAVIKDIYHAKLAYLKNHFALTNNPFSIGAKKLDSEIFLEDDNKTKLESSNKAPSKTNIQKRHIVVSSLSCGMGMGLFYASGQQLACSGAIGVIIAYSIVGIMIVFMFQSCCELMSCFPSVLLVDYSMMFIDQSLGFAVSVFYCLNQLIVFPLELISAVMITETYINLGSWKWCAVSMYALLVFFLSFLNHSIYCEAEFLLNLAKVTMMTFFLFASLAIMLGWNNEHKSIFSGGTNYFKNPGGLNTQSEGLLIKKIISVLITSIFSCAGIEYSAMTILEQDPSKINKTVRATSYQIVGRILCFYLAPFLLIGALVPYTNKNLLGSEEMQRNPSIPAKSPFALVFELHGIKVIPAIINFVIILSLISVSNSALHTSSANLVTLSENFQLPKWVGKKTNNRPVVAILISSCFGGLAYMTYLPDSETVFTYLVSVGGFSTMFLWTTICISHIKFRMFLKKQNINVAQLKYKSLTGVFGSYVAIFINTLIFCFTFWTSLWPVGKGELSLTSFIKTYSGLPIFLLLFVCHKSYMSFLAKTRENSGNFRHKLIVEKLQLEAESSYYDI